MATEPDGELAFDFGRSRATFTPLALALAERTQPQWAWLQCHYASVMSYRLKQIYLRDAFRVDTRFARRA